ncbi:MAG: ABC transporter ATP-binding protein [Actinomycetaceae bacterium]|nr:ABC transporter ATP-binding protein [Actinomycetaceae bacterium]
MSLYEIRGLEVGYGALRVLQGIDVDIPGDAVTAVIGPNGSGKSTLVKTLARLLPWRGQVLLDGKDIRHIPPRLHAKQVAFLPQSPVAPENLTVTDLVSRGRDPHRRWYDQWSARDEDVVSDALMRTGLDALADRPLQSLSGGQRQRAWVAMTIAQAAPVLLLDEPTTFLDIAHQIDILETVSRLRQAGRGTVIAVLHDLTLTARFADYVVALRDGIVYAEGRPEEVLTPENLRRVYDIEAAILADPATGKPVVVPGGLV